MAQLLPYYKSSLVQDVLNSVSNGVSNYYFFASNPVPNEDGIATETAKDLETLHEPIWTMLFGKLLSNNEIKPVVNYYQWTSNTEYAMYDDQANNLANSQFYVIVDPDEVGGTYEIFKCIFNANGAASTDKPDLVQASTFEKSDGYMWRYITSIPSAIYDKFATSNYFPIAANSTIIEHAADYASVDVCLVTNSGSGYLCHHEGTIQSVTNSTVVQIEVLASGDNDFYTNSGIYIYNESAATSQLRVITQYVSNLSGNWAYLDTPANTNNILPGSTLYRISPQVKFNTDGDSTPVAYSIVNTSANSIASIVMVDTGTNISRANVAIISNTSYGSGAVVRPIVPPPGGHGSNPGAELYTQGFAIYGKFSNTESGTISTQVSYNQVGIIKNPVSLSNGEQGASYTDLTFSQVLEANVSPATTFTVGEEVSGDLTGSVGIVAFSNSTTLFLVGDQQFEDGETVTSASGNTSAAISISKYGDLYYKDLVPLYVQNITDVTRANTQSEAFKIMITL